jgi:TonB family protein
LTIFAFTLVTELCNAAGADYPMKQQIEKMQAESKEILDAMRQAEKEQKAKRASIEYVMNSYAAECIKTIRQIANSNLSTEVAGRPQGSVLVTFEVLTTGELRGINVKRSSGHQILDDLATESVSKASPCPSFPAELKARAKAVVLTRTFTFIREFPGEESIVLVPNASNTASTQPQISVLPNREAQTASENNLFQITRMGNSDAEFLFFGWDKNTRSNSKQLITVQRGSNADTRIAVVRKMISIIREHEQEDFLWNSKRLGRNLKLSARPKDNAALEDFMMKEFFPDISQGKSS